MNRHVRDTRPRAPGATGPTGTEPGGRAPRRPLRVWAVTAVLALLLASCAALPRTGPVETAEPRLPAAQAATFYAGGPRDGASPEEIVQGFLNAQAAGYADGFAVAREFLASTISSAWDPTTQVRVHADTSAPQITTAGDGTVTVTADLAAAVGADGNYTEAPRGAKAELGFSLARTASDQWRIVDLPDGVLLNTYFFTTVFVAQPLYYLTPDRGALVPELRWFPRQDVVTGTVDALLAGPGEPLDEVVVTELPADLERRSEAVGISDGVAEVDLGPQLGDLPEPQRSLAVLQIERTLFSVSTTVRDVIVSSENERVEATAEVASLSAYPIGANPPVVAIADGALGRLVEGEVDALMSPAQAGIDEPNRPAVGYGGDLATVALLDGTSRLFLVDAGRSTTALLYTGEGLAPPSVDRHGWIWTARAGGELVAITRTGTTRTVDAPWSADQEVRALAVSREGSRIAVVATSGTETQVLVAGIARDADGGPQELTAPERVGAAIVDPLDVTWVEDTMLAALGRTDVNSPQPVVHTVQVGGVTRRLPLVEGATTITAGRGDRSLLVGTAAGEVWVRNGAGWRQQFRSGIADPAYPG